MSLTAEPACSRIQRDIVDRGRDVAGVIQQYTRFVKPAFDTYVAPSRKHADVIVPWARRAAAYGWLSPRALPIMQVQLPGYST